MAPNVQQMQEFIRKIIIIIYSSSDGIFKVLSDLVVMKLIKTLSRFIIAFCIDWRVHRAVMT